MKKFFYKKDVEQEQTPILNRVERRRTLLEVAKECESDRCHEMAVRTLSCGSSLQTEDPKFGSNSSATSTFIVTDSDLASSWIYASKREAANDVFEPPDQSPESQGVNSSPTFTVSRSKQCPKMCCCFSVSTIISLCAIGILCAIGGILYLEFFAPRQASSTSAIHGSEPSVKLTGFHLPNESPDVDDNDLSSTTSEEESAYYDVRDFGEPPRTSVSPSSRKGKLLVHGDSSSPDVNVLHEYVNGTINAMKNFIQMIKDASIQNSNIRRQELSNNRERNIDDISGSQSIFRKITSFLFSTTDPWIPMQINDNLGETKIDYSSDYDTVLIPSTEQSLAFSSDSAQREELGSGNADGDSDHQGGNDLSKVTTPIQFGIFSTVHTLPMNLEMPNTQRFWNNDYSTSMQDIFAKKLGKDLEISAVTPSIGSTDTSSIYSEAPTVEEQHTYSGMRNNISDSVARLIKIFRTIDRIKSVPSPSTSTESQNLLQVGISKREGEMDYGRNRNFATQERNQYLQRLRNLMYNTNEIY